MPEAQVTAPQETAKPVAPIQGRFELPPEPETPKAPEAPKAESAPPAAQKTEEQAPSTEPEDKPEEVTPDQAVKRESRRFERRIDKLHRERAEARARAELLERQLAEARQASQPKAPEEFTRHMEAGILRHLHVTLEDPDMPLVTLIVLLQPVPK